MIGLLRDLRESRDLLANLTNREVKGKYKRTALGQAWSLANPIALMIIYTAVFGFILPIPREPGDPSGLSVFALWLMCGLLPWTFFTGTVNAGMNALTSNENLIKKVWFPRINLIAAGSLATLYSWLIEMGVLAVALLVVGGPRVLVFLPLVLVAMALLTLFATGVSMIFSIANVHFRDMQHLSQILFQMWFYVTPILYPASLVQEGTRGIGAWVFEVYQLNPMARFVEVFRNLLYDQRLPELDSVLHCVGWTVVVLVVGARVFRRSEARLAELL